MKKIYELFATAPTMLKNEKGQTMVEYALIVAVVALLVVAGFTAFGTNLKSSLTTTSTYVDTKAAQ